MRDEPRAVARRYARAALDVASAQSPAIPAALGAELAALAALVEGHDELRRVVLNPGLASELRRRALAGVLEAAGATPLVRRLVELLVRHDRLAILGALAREYAFALNQREGRVAAEAVTAVPLAEAQASALTSALCAALGKTVELRARVDATVLGGVRVTMDGRTYDGTVRAQLAALRERLVSGS